jgi:hypothetical protein
MHDGGFMRGGPFMKLRELLPSPATRLRRHVWSWLWSEYPSCNVPLSEPVKTRRYDAADYDGLRRARISKTMLGTSLFLRPTNT